MGTKSNTVFIDGKSRILNLYRQFDGYPNGHGLELALCLAGYSLVNGYVKADQQTANGIGCLAAFVVSRLKTQTGNIYIVPIRDSINDYTYIVRGDTMHPKKGLKITVCEFGKKVFTGNLDQFITFCKQGD